jgi:signal transduction histidine kinase
LSLRLKLLLLGLATLVLPFGGCQYAREMESALRVGASESLTVMAQTIAASLKDRTELLYRSAQYDGARKAGPFDLQTITLNGTPLLDGYAEEWPQNSPAWRTVTKGSDRMRILTGIRERMLFMLVEVRDNKLVFDAPDTDPLDPAGFGDRVWIGFESPDRTEHQVFIATSSAGPVRAQRIETREYGRKEAIEEPRIEGAWQPIPGGYRLELRIPMSMLGARLGVLVDDRDQRGATASSYGTLFVDNLNTQGRLIAAATELDSYLAQFAQPGLRLTVTSPDGGELAEADSLGLPTEFGSKRGMLTQLYRRILDQPGDPKLIEAAAPIYDKRRAIIGQLHIAEAADRRLTLRDAALTNLLNFTLLVSALAVLGMSAFAAWLAYRLNRLRKASETALTREGLVTTFPDTAARDELGDVARSFSTLLGRLNDYTSYLRTLAGKLAHEIRTPLTIVRSSLENLESESTSDTARQYINRAREGSERLHTILVAMGAATRVEEAIQNADRTHFDVTPVISSAVESYRIGFPQRKFSAELPAETLEIDGAPDLIVQMLDKLIDNAVDFSPPDATITVRVLAEPDYVVIEVDNPGPTIAPDTLERLFESLWQSRRDKDSRPHFGLGLYIVRLIAQFHDGEARASNLPNDQGARFSVRLAR